MIVHDGQGQIQELRGKGGGFKKGRGRGGGGGGGGGPTTYSRQFVRKSSVRPLQIDFLFPVHS